MGLKDCAEPESMVLCDGGFFNLSFILYFNAFVYLVVGY
jgi:hypothetical protein